MPIILLKYSSIFYGTICYSIFMTIINELWLKNKIDLIIVPTIGKRNSV